MYKMQDEFTGMMVILKKRLTCLDQNDTDAYRYLMFGHYDGMDIVCTNQWYQMRPQGVAERQGVVVVDDYFLDKYTLKLYFPNRKYCSILKSKGFFYDLWRELGNIHQNAEKSNKILVQYPFISVAMINLSVECVRSEKNLLDKMQDAVVRAAEQKGISLRDIHCAVMPSIGYADFVLLFLSENLKPVITVLSSLRKERVMDDGKTYAMLSNCYAISGFAKVGLQKFLNCLDSDDTKLSIRVNLRDGVTASQFKNFFDSKLNESLQGSQNIAKEHLLYQVLGNSDCLMFSDKPFQNFISLFYDDKLFNPGHELFREYIQNMRSSIRLEICDSEEFEPGSRHDTGAYDKYQKEFGNLIDRLKMFFRQRSMPERTINGLQIVMKAYLNLIQFSHCFDIERVIGRAFEAVISNVEMTIGLVEKLQEDRKNEENEYKAKELEELSVWYSEQMMDALVIFRERIEIFLSDLRRSDRLFIEGQSLFHPSIGSATKLLFFYNRYINDTAESLRDENDQERNNGYTFVVTSGGCDRTTAYDLFSYIDPDEKSVHSLIIISIPEKSLYDFRGTMFRLLHECFHFCGERKRRERLKALLESLSENIALIIGKGLGGSFREQFDKIYNSIEKSVSEDDRKEIKSKEQNIFKEEINGLIKKLADEIYRRLVENIMTCSDDKIFYGRNMYRETEDILKRYIFASDEIGDENSFLRYTYHEFMKCHKASAERLIKYFKDKDILFSGADVWKEISDQNQKKEQENVFEWGEVKLIQVVFRNFVENTIFDKNIVDIAEDECVTMADVFANLENVFNECYADCMAARILQLPLEDFVLCFIYERRDCEIAFPDPLRVAMEMSVLYGLVGKLGDDNCCKIKKKMGHWEERGFSYQKHDGYIEEVCDQIDRLLKGYGGESCEYVGMESIEKYLWECLEFYDEKSFESVAEMSRLADMASSEDIYQLLEEIHNTWKGLSGYETAGDS